MPTITVVKGFLFDPGNGQLLPYAPGQHEVDEITASHPYVQAHLEGFVAPPPAPGTRSYAEQAQLAAQAARASTPVAAQGQKPQPPSEAAMAPPVRGGEGGTFLGRPAEMLDRPMPARNPRVL